MNATVAEVTTPPAVAAPWKCWRCQRTLADEAVKARITCPRCHARNQVGY